jgi:hypothetical protein
VSNQNQPHDGVVEDLLWNSLDGNVLKQRGKDRSLEDVLPQKEHIASSILKNEAEGLFPISAQGLPAVCLEGLPAVRWAGLSAYGGFDPKFTNSPQRRY